MQQKGMRMKVAVTMASTALLIGMSASATDYYWSNATGDNNYMTTNNWLADGVVATNLPSAPGDVAYINTNGTDKCVFSSGTPNNINSIHVGFGSGVSGELEVTGGTLKATANSSRYSYVGDGAGSTGLLTVDGGTLHINRFDIGRNTGTGSVVIADGTLNVARGYSGYSIRLDVNGNSDADLEISGGVLTTRVGAQINAGGTFTVKGSAPTISIGGSGSGACYWDVNSGGTLAVQIDSGGLSPIEIDNDSATASYATFDAGSYLEPSFLDSPETNAWVVMTLDHSDVAGTGITADELAFAPGVDTNNWAFGLATNLVDEVDVLWVGYAGAVYTPPTPAATTNLYVDAVGTMADTWNLFAPQGGSTALSDQSSSGFTATLDTVTNWLMRPVVAQEFDSDRDISEVGQSITVNFDVELLNEMSVQNDCDFRFAFYDTNVNAQIIAGLIDLGSPGGTTMKIRVEEKVSLNSEGEDPGVFIPGNYANLGNGSVSLGSSSTAYPGNGFQTTGVVYHIETSVARITSNELSVATAWSDNVSTALCSCVIDESAPLDPDGMPSSGTWDTINGFGFKIFDDQPFESLTEGSYRISNFELSYATSLQQGFSYELSDFEIDDAGDVTLTLSDPVVGATYIVRAKGKLVGESMQEIGSYVVGSDGTILVPAADLSGITGELGFFDAGLPVTVIVE